MRHRKGTLRNTNVYSAVARATNRIPPVIIRTAHRKPPGRATIRAYVALIVALHRPFGGGQGQADAPGGARQTRAVNPPFAATGTVRVSPAVTRCVVTWSFPSAPSP